MITPSEYTERLVNEAVRRGCVLSDDEKEGVVLTFGGALISVSDILTIMFVDGYDRALETIDDLRKQGYDAQQRAKN